MMQRKTHQQSKNLKTLRIGGVVILIVIASVGYLLMTSVKSPEQQRMESYLANQYQEKFTVSNIRTEGSGFGVRGEIVGDASPADNPGLKFNVSNASDGYHDRYPQILWSTQGREEVEMFLSKSNIDHTGYILDVGTKLSPNIPAPLALPAGHIVSLNDAFDRYPDIIYYNLSVRDDASMGGTQPSDNKLDDVFKIVEFVKNKGVEASVYYLYGKQADNNYQYAFNLEKGAINTVKSKGDLKTYFEIRS